MNSMLRDIQCIGFDADDTLWENNNFYNDAEKAFWHVLSDIAPETVSQRFAETETRNMPELGYGAKAMTINMIETAIALSPEIRSNAILRIIDIGRGLMRQPVIMLPDVEEVISILRAHYRIVILTKGETQEQSRKFEISPLPHDIPYVIMTDKTPETYRAVLSQLEVAPESFLMVGNSPRSDVLAPLAIGAYAAYIPYQTTWSHEDCPIPDHPKLIRLTRIRALLPLLV